MISRLLRPHPGAQTSLPLETPKVRLGGLLGTALEASAAGRLHHLVKDGQSAPFALFAPERVKQNHEGDWYGEHAGKWLYASAKSALRTGDAELKAKVRRAADYLLSVQGPDGYLGTYAPENRFMRAQPPGPKTWDGAPGQRTWDIWTHSYLVLGLLSAEKLAPGRGYLAAARKIGDLCLKTLQAGVVEITQLGNHHGMSATVLLDPAVELYFATQDPRYLELAKLIVRQADARPELNLLTQALNGTDAADIASGKAYQLSWNLVGLAKLYTATGDPQYLKAVLNVWKSIRQNHLTLGGGPWGGIAHRSREVFNHETVFDPHGYVETCSTLSWIQLNRELLTATGEPSFADEIERSAYNDLLGAQAPNGHDWIYYSFPNGKRVFTTEWRCCKSSGAMALEELPEIAYTLGADNTVSINLYGPSRAVVPTTHAGALSLQQVTDYPLDGAIRLRVTPERSGEVTLRLRIPEWATGASVKINGVESVEAAIPGSYLVLKRVWKPGDELALQFPMSPVLHKKSSRNVQSSLAPDGTPVNQEVMRRDYLALTRGPLVYALGATDGLEESLRLPPEGAEPVFETLEPPDGFYGPAVRVRIGERALTAMPYFEAGGREDGSWRQTWVQVVGAPPASRRAS